MYWVRAVPGMRIWRKTKPLLPAWSGMDDDIMDHLEGVTGSPESPRRPGLQAGEDVKLAITSTIASLENGLVM